MPASNLAEMLSLQERKLALSLDESRAAFDHKGIRGGKVESAFREMLDSHLPRYLTIGTGEVIDRADTRTGQIDVVIANQDQPFRQAIHDPGLFLIEGVAAACELKSRLTTTQLDLAIESGTRFKQLRNRHIKGDTILVSPSDRQRFYDCPPYFLVAFENDVAVETLLARLNQANDVAAADGSGTALPSLDAVFILGQGTAVNYGDGQGSLGFIYTAGPHAGQLATGWVWSVTDTVLMELLLWLNATMPRVQRLEGIATQYLIQQLAMKSNR